MKISNLKRLSYTYLIVPIILFMLGWVKLKYSIPITIMLLYVSIKIYKQCQNEDERIITIPGACILFVCIIILCLLGGHGGMFYQTSDWNERNAIFRDLIKHEWPIYYEVTDCALTYYIGQWMVPAVIGKLIKTLFINMFGVAFFNNTDITFCISNIFLLYWNALGVFLACLWLLKILKLKGNKAIIAIILFLGFSGIDVLGMILSGYAGFEILHLEWWAYGFQYSSMITQLFWVFNQCIPIWIITLMFYDEKRVNNYMLIILLSVPFSPIGTVGLSILFFGRAIVFLIESIKEERFKEFLKDVFSPQNILALIAILPIFLLYYLSNASVQGSDAGGGFNILFDKLDTAYERFLFTAFLLFELGVFAIVAFKKYRKEPMYYIVFLPLMIIPIFQLGYQYDFCMRASLPALVIIALWTVECFLEELTKNKITKYFIYICCVITLGSITPAVELYRGFYWAWNTQKIDNVCDKMKTFDRTWSSNNFLTMYPEETSVFYKYIAK